MRWLGHLHGKAAFRRRVERLSNHLSPLIPEGSSVVDVGCGDGLLSYSIQRMRTDIQIQGIDIFVRDSTYIPVTEFDGRTMPFGDKSIDVVLFVDVLHHTLDPIDLLTEAARVASDRILIKDHILHGPMSKLTLRLMDWVGNKPHEVVLPYNYWTLRQWKLAFRRLGLVPEVWIETLRLYPPFADWIFGRSLHFVTSLKFQGAGVESGG